MYGYHDRLGGRMKRKKKISVMGMNENDHLLSFREKISDGGEGKKIPILLPRKRKENRNKIVDEQGSLQNYTHPLPLAKTNK